MDQELFGFPLWLRINHFINLFCIFVLMRSLAKEQEYADFMSLLGRITLN